MPGLPFHRVLFVCAVSLSCGQIGRQLSQVIYGMQGQETVSYALMLISVGRAGQLHALLFCWSVVLECCVLATIALPPAS